MFKRFDFTATSKRERLLKASLIGLVVAFILGVSFSVLNAMLPFGLEFSLLYLLLGFLMGKTVAHIGRGVTAEFAYLAAILTFIMLLTADVTTVLLVVGWQNLSFATIAFVLKYTYFGTLLELIGGQNVLNNGLFLLFRIFAIFVAYNYSRPTINR